MSAPKFSHIWMAVGMVGRMCFTVAVIGAFCALCIYFAGPAALSLP
jgi:hypothetical protein